MTAERFWPSLIDRLDGADRGELPLDDHFVDQQTLKHMIKLSLERLLNTVHLESGERLDGFDHVRRSILNYGIPDLAGRIRESLDAPQLQRRIREAILTYEPRFRPDTLSVAVINQLEDGNVATERPLELSIEGEVWATPTPERVILRTLFDIEGGGAAVEVD